MFRAGLFDGKRILITGGGTGIGRCIAHELAALGATVILAARREEPLLQTKAEIELAGGKAETLILNIRDEDQVAQGIATLVADGRQIDALVNNAGGQFASPAVMIRPKGWRAVIDTNLTGTWLVSQAVYTQCFAKLRRGVMVNIIADMRSGFPGMAHTGAARAGVENLTMTLAQEWAPSGVRVNAVAPGFVLSSGLKNYPEAVQKMAAEMMVKNPSSRIGTESEVSAAVAFLLCPAAAYISGITLRVDGGSSLQRAPMVPLVAHQNIPAWDGFHLAADLPEVFKQS